MDAVRGAQTDYSRTDHGPQITITNRTVMKKSEILHCCENVTQGREVSKYCWRNGINRLAQCRVATDLSFAKEAISGRCRSAKPSKEKAYGRHFK